MIQNTYSMFANKLPLILSFIVVVGGLATGIALYAQHKTTQQQTVVMKQQPSATPIPSPTVLPAGNDNTQLDDDTVTVDNSLNTANTNINSVDQSLNDKATNLQ